MVLQTLHVHQSWRSQLLWSMWRAQISHSNNSSNTAQEIHHCSLTQFFWWVCDLKKWFSFIIWQFFLCLGRNEIKAATRPRTSSTGATINELKKTSWICQKCTLINPIADAVCSACNCSQLYSEKKVQEASNGSPKKKEVWSCSQCTLLNSNTLTKCRACKTLREPLVTV